MEATGHGSWPYLSAVVVGILVAALCGFAADRASGPPDRRTPFSVLYRSTVLRLVPLQTLGFLALEAAERAAVGHVGPLTDEVVLPIGLVLQAFAALVGALLLVLVARTVDVLVDGIRASVPEAIDLIIPPVLRHPRPRLAPATGGPGLRGPPSTF